MITVLACVEETALQAALDAALVLYGHQVRFARLDDPDFPPADVYVVDFVRGLELKVQRFAARHTSPIVLLIDERDEPLPLFRELAGRVSFATKPLAPRELRLALRVALAGAQESSSRERWLRTTLRSIADAVITSDQNSRVSFMNPSAERLTGLTEAVAKGLPVDDVFAIDAVDAVDAVDAGDGAANARAQLVRLRRRDGGTRLIEHTAAPIVDDDGRLHGAVVVFRDVGERLQLERRMALTDRVAALGTVAAGVAHELNNPLSYVMANIDVVLEGMPSGDALAAPASAETVAAWRAALSDASSGVARAARIVKDMRVLLSGEKSPAAVDVNGCVSLAARLARPTLGPDVSLEVAVADVPRVSADESLLVQVLVALLTNAAQAFEAGSAHQTIRVTARRDGDVVVIRIEDSGRGMSPRELERAFDPFFTTRAVGEGMGLGLSIAWTAVERMNGTIELDSAPGQGTKVTISLPAASEKKGSAT